MQEEPSFVGRTMKLTAPKVEGRGEPLVVRPDPQLLAYAAIYLCFEIGSWLWRCINDAVTRQHIAKRNK